MARMASGGRHGLAQSLFQVGGNSVGDRAAAGGLRRGAARPVEHRVVLPRRTVGIVVLVRWGRWFNGTSTIAVKPSAGGDGRERVVAPVVGTIAILLRADFLQVFLPGQYWQLLHVLSHGHVLYRCRPQLHLFMFLGRRGSTILGGPIGDRLGRFKFVISGVPSSACCRSLWLLPYANLFWTQVLTS